MSRGKNYGWVIFDLSAPKFGGDNISGAWPKKDKISIFWHVPLKRFFPNTKIRNFQPILTKKLHLLGIAPSSEPAGARNELCVYYLLCCPLFSPQMVGIVVEVVAGDWNQMRQQKLSSVWQMSRYVNYLNSLITVTVKVSMQSPPEASVVRVVPTMVKHSKSNLRAQMPVK